MANTGWKIATASTGTWVDVANDYADDGSYGQETTNALTQVWTTFTAGGTSLYNAIPSGATINFITVRHNGYITVTFPINGDFIRLTTSISEDGGGSYSATKNLNQANIDFEGDAEAGGADTWGLTVDKESFSDSNFKVKTTISGLTGGVEVLFTDYIAVYVDYTEAATAEGRQGMVFYDSASIL